MLGAVLMLSEANHRAGAAVLGKLNTAAFRRLLRHAAGRLGWGVADQAVSSLTNFAVVLYVARALGAAQFGAFSLAYVTYGFALNASRGLATDPLLVRFSGADVPTWRRAVADCTGTAAAVGVATGGCVLAAAALLDGTVRGAFLALGLTLPGLLLQDSWRYAFFALGRGSQAAINDVVWASALVPGLLFLRATGHANVFWFVFAWGAAAAVAAIVGLVQARVVPKPSGLKQWVSRHRDLGPRYFAENTSNSAAVQLRTYGVGVIAGLAAVGHVQAAYTLMGPFMVIFFGLNLVTVPEAARVLRRSPRHLWLFCLLLSSGLALAGLVWGVILLAALPRGLGSWLLGPIWRPAYPLVLPLTISVMGSCATAGPGAGLHALGAARRSMRAMVLASASFLFCGLVGAAAGGAFGAVCGAAVATWIGALLWWGQLHAGLRESRAVPAHDRLQSRLRGPRRRRHDSAQLEQRSAGDLPHSNRSLADVAADSEQSSSATPVVPVERPAVAAAGRDPENKAVAPTLEPAPTGDLVPAGGRSLTGLVAVLVRGQLPQVAGLDPYILGATPSACGNAATYGERDHYVPRSMDGPLAAALQAGQLVVVAGPSKVGKTRTAFEALRRHDVWGHALLAAPTPGSLDELAVHPAMSGSRPLVVWLDDLARFLPPTGGLSQATISRLARRAGPVVLLATMRAGQRELLNNARGDLTGEARLILSHATSIELDSTREDRTEQARVAAAYPQAGSGAEEGLAEILSGAREPLRRYRDAATADPLLRILVQTCVDWARCGLTRPIPERDLLTLARDALAENRPDLRARDGELDEALHRACKPVAAAGQIALLRSHDLPGRSHGYEAFDYLVAADDGQECDGARPVGEKTWRYVLDQATAEEALCVGVSSYLHGNVPVAVAASYRAAEAGHTRAQYSLGILLATAPDPPNLAEARTWWARAAEAGHTGAQYGLGVLLADELDSPDLAGATTWWKRAAEGGHVGAQYTLGVLIVTGLDPASLAEARTWWARAAEAGHTCAQYGLGMLLAYLLDPPELAEARRWWTRAAEAGHVGAQYCLGRLLAIRLDPPDLAEARRWWTRAAEAGHTDAQFNLGVLLAYLLDPPELAEARKWYTRAAQVGDTDAQFNLGVLLADLLDPPELAEARRWWTRAAEAGDTDAQFNLGVLLADLLDSPGAGRGPRLVDPVR
jgi:TPR repeat protein/O-antigen/teichoic acid export membrane protein